MASSRCVFCGEPIADADPTVGRAPQAAHATCADAALADDAHWDAVAAASGVQEDTAEPETRQEPPRRRGIGCATIAVSVTLAVGLLVDARKRALTRR